MENRGWNILLVEDDEDDYILTKTMLAEANGGKYQLEWAPSYDEAKKALLVNTYAAVLMDYKLGPQTGLDLVREVAANGYSAPIILLTGQNNYELDLAAMEAGVTDYLVKQDVTPLLLERSIRYSILQRQNEVALRAAKQDLENRVIERTQEITNKNIALEAEIAERKRIEGELAEMQRRLLDHAENERLQLARELHDGPMQDLYGITFQVDTIVADLQEGQSPETVRGLKNQILEVINALRSISRELRPPSLAPYGLEKAIRSHAENLRQAHPELRISLYLEPDGQSLAEGARMALFRIYQTAITNILRHAGAQRAEIRFTLDTEHATLEIQDNGRGFNLPNRWITFARQGHMGLVGAFERAQAAGGKLEIITQPGQGTLVRVRVPRHPASSSRD